MSNDDSTTVAAISTSIADKLVGALTKTSAVMGGNQDGVTSTVHSTAVPGITAQPQWARCSGWNSTEFSSSFLEHASGQGISGACAWAAILITCHQVNIKAYLQLPHNPKRFTLFAVMFIIFTTFHN